MKNKVVTLLLLMAGMAISASAQTATFKALFLYNFSILCGAFFGS